MNLRIAASYAAASTPRCVETRCGSLGVVIGAPHAGAPRGLAGDPVLLAEPAAEIDQVAALAAEREQLREPGRGGLLHRRLARGAHERLHGASPCSGSSARRSNPSAVI